MNAQQRALWTKLEAFEFDPPGVEFTFARRLARENKWSLAFAERVIVEYKRFILLAVEAGHPVTPSHAVDQAWHLHLSYSKSYWEHLCADVLRRPLHHNPTEGGKAESQKFADWYAQTLASYERIFGSKPHPDFWPDVTARFARPPSHGRFSASGAWTTARRLGPRGFLRGVAFIAIIAGFVHGVKFSQIVDRPFAPDLGLILVIAGAVLFVLSFATRGSGFGCGTGGSCGGGGCGGGGCGGGGCGGGGGGGD